jgi:hypothetical protein
MARAQAEATGTEGVVKRKVNRGARGPQPIYLFVKTNESGKQEVAKSFRDARKMAAFMQSEDAAGTTFLVTTPE